MRNGYIDFVCIENYISWVDKNAEPKKIYIQNSGLLFWPNISRILQNEIDFLSGVNNGLIQVFGLFPWCHVQFYIPTTTDGWPKIGLPNRSHLFEWKIFSRENKAANRRDIFVLLTAIFVFWNVSSNLAFTEEFKNRMLCLQQKI